jgi:hypothetical protein
MTLCFHYSIVNGIASLHLKYAFMGISALHKPSTPEALEVQDKFDLFHQRGWNSLLGRKV